MRSSFGMYYRIIFLSLGQWYHVRGVVAALSVWPLEYMATFLTTMARVETSELTQLAVLSLE